VGAVAAVTEVEEAEAVAVVEEGAVVGTVTGTAAEVVVVATVAAGGESWDCLWFMLRFVLA